MACDSSIFRPIDSFIKYFGDIKPYHTKILEVVEQYVFREEINVYIDETPTFELTVSNNPLCKGVGFGLDFDDACGFDALECCDLFECVGGFGLVFDNSDLLVTAQVNSIDGSSGQLNIPFEGVPLHNTGNGQVHVAGNHLYDTFINIKSIPNLGEIRLDGDYSSYFNSHNLFWVVRKNSLAINSILTPITFTLTGNHVDALLAKINFEVLNAGLNDGHYGVVNATYNTGTGLTTITTNRELPATTLGTILFESNNKNNGVYQMASFSVVAGETRIILEAETQARYMDAEIPEEEGYGAIQLRTGFVPNRKLWIENDNTPNHYVPLPCDPDEDNCLPNNGEWKINQAWYDVSTDETIIVVDGTLLDSTNPTTVIKLYGYETAAGYDALNECSEPQPFNINASISEYVVIQVIDIPLPSAPATQTPTPTVTLTPTITPTITPTRTVTATMTPPPPSATETPGASVTATPTPTVTATVTATLPATPTTTPAVTATVTPTVTVTVTPTSTPTPTPTPSAELTDPYFENVVLLMNGDTLTDQSSYGTTVTNSGDITIDGSLSPYLGGTSLVNSNAAGYLDLAASSIFELGTEFTLEYWIRPSSLATGSYFMATSATRYMYYIANTSISSNQWGSSDFNGGIVPETWTHIALVRDASGAETSYVNGIARATYTDSNVYSGSVPFGVFDIPERPDLQAFLGNLAGIRYTQGVARYTADFTPSTEPFPTS